MVGEWRETSIGEFAPFAYGKALPEHRRDSSGDVPVFGSNGVVGFHGEALTSGPTVIIGRKGTVGAVHYSPNPCWPIDTTFYVVDPDPDVLRFKYYLLKSLDLEHMNADSAVPGLNRDAADALKILVPPLPEQRAIARILGTLDDKIELNRRVSETLEAMARALFKAWFVDFEPVRAKMEGRWQRGQSLPGLPAYLYDLFPARLVDSELGEIPEGWEVGTLGDLAEVTSGKRPSKVFPEAMPEAVIPLWGGNGPMGYVSEPLCSRPILLTGRVGTLGAVFRISTPCWPSDNTLVVLAHEKVVFEFLYFRMMALDFDALNRGSTQPLLTQSDLSTQRFAIPSTAVLNKFHEHASGYFLKIDHIMNESRTLAALRDALLPKLIRGEIRVKDAERFLEERGL